MQKRGELLVTFCTLFLGLFFCPGEIKDGILRIGKASLPVYNPHEKMKVPDVLFYENEQVSQVQGIII